MTVAEMLRRIDSAELSEWMAYERVAGPLGGARGDQQAAVVASTVANAMRSKGRAYKVDDFVPQWGPSEQSHDDLLAKALAINAALGGVDLRGDDSRAGDRVASQPGRGAP